MAENGKVYQTGFLAQGSGDFIQVTNFSITSTVNAKVKHTLRKSGAGVMLGVKESSVSFDLIVDGDGPERDFHRQMEEGVEVQLRAKIPGGVVLTLNGKYGDLGVDAPLDDVVKYSLGFVGKLEKPSPIAA